MRNSISKKLTAIILIAVQLVCMIPAMAFLSNAASVTPKPFAYSNAVYQNDGVKIGGVQYYDGVLFTMGYTGISNGHIGEATYNLKAQYSTFFLGCQ